MSIIHIPDTLRNWTWPRTVNPHFKQCKAESSAWAEGFHAFSAKAQKAFNNCDFSLLASMVYPKLNKDGCRVGCDLMNVFFVFDEWSDVSTAEETREMANIIMDALRNPYDPRPKGEWVGGELTRQFWVNAIRTATPIAQRRFIEKFDEYTTSIVEQSSDRDRRRLRTIEDFFEIRRKTIGAKPSFVVNELHMSLPDYVMENEIIQRLHATCVDMICIGNDLYSYNVEQSRGDSLHNLVTIVMHQLQLDVQGAFDWIGKLHDQLVQKFMDDYRNVPSWGPRVDEEVALYIDDLGNWIRANEQWSFESQRYFGTDRIRTLKERTITLLPSQGYSSVKPDKQGI